MGLFDFLKSDKKKKERENTVITGTGMATTNSANKSIQAASEKFTKPNYNRDNRPKFYDNKDAKEAFKNKAFSD